jgi:hypothetical protein
LDSTSSISCDDYRKLFRHWANEFRWELARHSPGEELVVYSAFEKKLGDEGKRMADDDRAQHQEVYRLKLCFIIHSFFFLIF